MKFMSKFIFSYMIFKISEIYLCLNPYLEIIHALILKSYMKSGGAIVSDACLAQTLDLGLGRSCFILRHLWQVEIDLK